jgi:DNA-binding transcriptional ArsR family regulator
MSDASESSLQQCEECVAPAEAFSLIANETRLSILEALWRAERRPVRFSDLRSAVGMRDSAQFNYHLSKLTDQYVVKVDDEDGGGYDLRHAGEKVVRAVISGSFNEHPHVDPFEVEGSCAWCEGPLEAHYEDEMLAVVCRDCERTHGDYAFPPGGLNDRTDEEVASAFDQRVRHLHCLAADGVCPECSGRMVTELAEDGDCCLGDGLRADHVCRQCEHTLCSTVGLSLLDKSPVVAFYADHGVDLSSRPYWTLPWCVRDDRTEVLSRDPWRLAVTVERGGESLTVELDGSLRILATDRS